MIFRAGGRKIIRHHGPGNADVRFAVVARADGQMGR
jgi:hypothetical protein